MMKKKSRTIIPPRMKKVIILFLAAVLLLAFALSGFWQIRLIQNRREALDSVSTQSYDSIFLSMYPITNYSAEDFTAFRGLHTLKSSYVIRNTRELKDFLDTTLASGNSLSNVYLGIDPVSIWKEARRESARCLNILETRLVDMIRNHPETHFELILSYPSLEYWKGHSSDTVSAYMQASRTLLNLTSGVSNAAVYNFGGQEWLFANPGNYNGEMLTNADVSQTIMLNADTDHAYVLTPENADGKLNAAEALISGYREAADKLPDLSGLSIVFFGDSVIANYTGSLSIPGVIEGLTGARTYNCGYGGNSAAMGPKTLISLPGIAEAFVQKDLAALPAESQLYEGISSYLEDGPDAPDCFVINYGLNDYFEGYPVSSQDPYDITTYQGALRSAVATLQKAYPDTPVLLLAPSFCVYFSYGTEKMGSQGGVLTDYVEAAVSLSEELGVACLNSYEELGINAENELEYLADGCHPNEAGRFLMGKKIVEKLGQILPRNP